MIIHVYYDMHHLKVVAGFGYVLEKIVYSRQLYIEVGVSRASLAQLSKFFVRDSLWRLVARALLAICNCQPHGPIPDATSNNRYSC
jgi:hypothetical protein